MKQKRTTWFIWNSFVELLQEHTAIGKSESDLVE